jgi:hypothetical protein
MISAMRLSSRIFMIRKPGRASLSWSERGFTSATPV